jgi:siroheme synthase (precorrin-2 oxidase/ferrochelatase)
MSSCLEFINRLRASVIRSMMDGLERNMRFKTRCKFYPVNNTADKEEEEVEGVEEDIGPPPPPIL